VALVGTLALIDPGSNTIKRVVPIGENPRFQEWSKAAQPAGYPDRIIFALGCRHARASVRARPDAVETLV